MRRLVLTTLLALGLTVGSTAGAAADSASFEDPVGDAVIHRQGGEVQQGVRSPVDIHGLDVVAGRYRTRLSLRMTDVRRDFHGGFSFGTQLTGADGSELDLNVELSRGGWSGSLGGDHVAHDCPFPKMRLNGKLDILFLSLLNDCVGNAEAVRARLNVAYRPTERRRVTDRVATGWVDY